jgi:Domain of unknown function (DUF4357)
MNYGKQLRIFLTSGLSSAIKYAELVNWTGQAFSCPKNLLPELKAWPETQRPGVYVLIGVNEKGGDLSYIGESEDVLGRIFTHQSSPPFEIVEVLIITSKDDNLTKGHITFLEQRLQDRAKQANRIPIVIGREPSEKQLSKPERATMEEFLDNIYVVAATLGFTLFELQKKTKTTKRQFKLELEKGVVAKGYLVEEGFLVEAASTATVVNAKSLEGGYHQLKESLVSKGILSLKDGKYVFTADYTFNSSTAAASVVSGSQRSGPATWKDEDGKTLGEIEAEIAKKAAAESGSTPVEKT